MMAQAHGVDIQAACGQKLQATKNRRVLVAQNCWERFKTNALRNLVNRIDKNDRVSRNS